MLYEAKLGHLLLKNSNKTQIQFNIDFVLMVSLKMFIFDVLVDQESAN